MCDPGGTPVINSHVYACNLGEPHRARFPVRREIGLCAVITVPHVVDRYFVTIDFCRGSLGNVRLPGAIIARLQRQPPRSHKRARPKDNPELQQFFANE
jgi:hypothetical protein